MFEIFPENTKIVEKNFLLKIDKRGKAIFKTLGHKAHPQSFYSTFSS